MGSGGGMAGEGGMVVGAVSVGDGVGLSGGGNGGGSSGVRGRVSIGVWVRNVCAEKEDGGGESLSSSESIYRFVLKEVTSDEVLVWQTIN